MLGVINAIISGILMSVQGVFNTEVTKRAGLWVATGWVQLSAFAVCVIAWLITGMTPVGTLMRVQQKYMLLGGILGAFITVTVVQSMGALGPAKSVLLIVIAQLTAAYLIELVGAFGVDRQPFEIRKLVGMAVAIVGVVIFKWE